MSNEELAFLSYGKTAKIRSGTGVIGGAYTYKSKIISNLNTLK